MKRGKITIRKKTASYNEKNILIILMGIAIICIVAAITLKIFEYKICLKWSEFLINIMLGISASAFISWVIIYVPLKRNKIQAYNQCCNKISGIYIICHKLLLPNIIVDDLKELTVNLDDRVKKINEFYYNIDYNIESVDNIINIINSKIPKVILEINAFISSFSKLNENIENIKELYNKEVYNSAIQELYNYLQNNLKTVYSIKELTKDFEDCIDLAQIHYQLLSVNLNKITENVSRSMLNTEAALINLRYLQDFAEILSSDNLEKYLK